jgi:hypothetical protein
VSAGRDDAEKTLMRIPLTVDEETGSRLYDPDRIISTGKAIEFMSKHGRKADALEYTAFAFQHYGTWNSLTTWPNDKYSGEYSKRWNSFLLRGLAAYIS